jgi:hypothetical protein
MKVPAKMGDVIHTIEVPAKFAKHREHYIRGYMQGYVRLTDALAARRRSLEGPKKSRKGEKASHEDFKPKETRLMTRLRKGVDDE